MKCTEYYDNNIIILQSVLSYCSILVLWNMMMQNYLYFNCPYIIISVRYLQTRGQTARLASSPWITLRESTAHVVECVQRMVALRRSWPGRTVHTACTMSCQARWIKNAYSAPPKIHGA